MKLNKLIDTEYDIEITNITDNSRKIKENALFVAIKGLTTNGNKYIDKAIENGAKAVITEEDIISKVPTIKVKNIDYVYNEILNKFYNYPLNKINLIGVTGTDGKTTTCEILYQLLNMQTKSAYIGTNGIRCPGFAMENDFTTPMPDVLFESLDNFVKKDAKYLAMEASSERLFTKKLSGINFDLSIFTNLTPDHLETHKTMENYALAKSMLFNQTKKDGLSIINIDDKYKDYFLKAANGKIITYSIDNMEADIYATNVNVKHNKLSFNINGIYGEHEIETNLSGKFNVYNLLASIVTLKHYGFEIDTIINNIKRIKPIDARQSEIDLGQNFNVIVDYAHTKNAVENLVNYVKSFSKRIIIVTGAAGSRDEQRHLKVAKFCEENSDYTFYTIEDPRNENPETLLKSMVRNIENKNYDLIIDRNEAIKKALYFAKEGDTVLILGKGLENYQKVNGTHKDRINDYDYASGIVKQLKKNNVKNI